MKKVFDNYRLNFILLFAFFLVVIGAFYLTRDKLTIDFDELNKNITVFLSEKEEKRVENFEKDFSLFKNRVMNVEKLSVSDEWFAEAFDNSFFFIARPYLEYYIIRNNRIYTSAEEPASFEELSKKEWYQQIIKHKGTKVYTAPYQNSQNLQSVVTIAEQLPDTGTVVALNVYICRNRDFLASLTLPKQSVYSYFDFKGQLIQSIAADGNSDYNDRLAKSVFDIIDGLDKANRKGGFVHTFDGEKYGIFYYRTNRDWVSFITVPYSSIYPTPWIFIGAMTVLCLFSFITFYSYLREKRLHAENKYKEETIEFLGNMYFFIVRVDFIHNTFKFIKVSDELKDKVQNIARYDKLIEFLSEQIEQNARDDFLQFFVMKNIQDLLNKQMGEYSGDFRGNFLGEYRWINARLIINKSFNSKEAILCFRDIENEKLRQINQVQLLQSSLEQAQKSEQAKNQFFANMSHDMRTPLNAIMGYIALAEQLPEKSPEMLEYLNKISSSSDHLLEIIDYILNVSRVEHEKQQNLFTEINLAECVKSCLEPFYAIAQTQKKHFDVSFDIITPYVLSSCFKIRQILNNIVSNSFKYSAEGADISVKVRQLFNSKHSKYEITVSDTGFGISKEFLDTIFVPYSKEVRFSSSERNGSGLGLNIVKNIVSFLNGEMLIDSEVGKGTTVIVVLTMETVSEEEVKKEAVPDVDVDISGKHLLLVDDNIINMEILEKLLSSKGVACDKAYNGKEALAKFEESPEFHYDCILMDLQMPVMGGLEASQKIRNLQRNDAQFIPIIALTANAFAEDVIATINAGMDCHIAKPVNSKLLFHTIYNFIKTGK